MYCTVEALRLKKGIQDNIYGTELISEAIQDASQIIDNKLRGIYDVPFQPVPGEIRRICMIIAHCLIIYDRKVLLAEDQDMLAGTTEYCKKAYQDLEDLRAGVSHLGVANLQEFGMHINPGRREWEFND